MTNPPEAAEVLEACPGCGSVPRFEGLGRWGIICDCGWAGPSSSRYHDEAIAAWNTRAIRAQPSREDVCDMLQRAWLSVDSLPPIDFTIDEAAALAAPFLALTGSSAGKRA